MHKDFVLRCLQQYPDMTSAQIYDWIKERTGAKKLPFRMRSFRNYVRDIRKEYDIPKPEKERQYEAVADMRSPGDELGKKVDKLSGMKKNPLVGSFLENKDKQLENQAE